MPIMNANCPRCNAINMTFDVESCNETKKSSGRYSISKYEFFAVCKGCKRGTIFIADERGYPKLSYLSIKTIMEVKDSLNTFFSIQGYVNVRDNIKHFTPDFVPENIKAIFEEGVTSLSTQCWNAAGAMFRLCLDLTTKDILPKGNIKGLTPAKKKKLADRIDWYFENKKLPENLKQLADRIRLDGNDGVHDGTLTENDALNLLDFTVPILEHFYTTPAKIEESKKRQSERKEELKLKGVSLSNSRSPKSNS